MRKLLVGIVTMLMIFSVSSSFISRESVARGNFKFSLKWKGWNFHPTIFKLILNKIFKRYEIANRHKITTKTNPTSTSNGKIITVDDEGDGNFTRIQDAVDNASIGDTILIYSGTYHEEIKINKTLSIIGVNRELGSGNDTDYPVIDGKGELGIAIELSKKARSTSIKGLRITGYIARGIDSWADRGLFKKLRIENCVHPWNVLVANAISLRGDNCVVEDCVFYANEGGVGDVRNSSGNVVRNCMFKANTEFGLDFEGTNEKIENNKFVDDSGITIREGSKSCMVSENVFDNSKYSAIYIYGRSDNTILSGNDINGGKVGIHLQMYNSPSNIIVEKNHISSTSDAGIYLKDVDTSAVIRDNVISKCKVGIEFESYSDEGFNNKNIPIYKNTILYCKEGISLKGCENIKIFENVIKENEVGIGCSVRTRYNNIYHNNFIDNDFNAYDFSGLNKWNEKYPEGGNYWSDYSGRDEDSDGIGDKPYKIPTSGIDEYPFVEAYGWENLPPSAPMITGPSSGKIGVYYTYNFSSEDPEGGGVYYYIDWGDGSYIKWEGPFPSGKVVRFSHKWDRQATYTIRAKAKDEYGKESKWGILRVSMPYVVEKAKPTAVAEVNKIKITKGDYVVTFISEKSHDNDENGKEIKWIRWDFDGDGKWDTGSKIMNYWIRFKGNERIIVDLSYLFNDNNGHVSSLASHQNSIGSKTYFARLEVKDNEGDTDIDYVSITVMYS